MQCIILSRINPCSPTETQTFHSRIIGKVGSPWRANQMVFQIKTILGEKNITLEISEKKLDNLMVKILFLLFVSMWLDHRELWPLRRQAIKDVNAHAIQTRWGFFTKHKWCKLKEISWQNIIKAVQSYIENTSSIIMAVQFSGAEGAINAPPPGERINWFCTTSLHQNLFTGWHLYK